MDPITEEFTKDEGRKVILDSNEFVLKLPGEVLPQNRFEELQANAEDLSEGGWFRGAHLSLCRIVETGDKQVTGKES